MTSLILSAKAGPYIPVDRYRHMLSLTPYLPPGRQMLQDQLVCSQTFKSIQHSVDKWQFRVQSWFRDKKNHETNRKKDGLYEIFLLIGWRTFI